MEWAMAFWIFWKSAKCVDPEKTVFVLCHMDEKWFYAVRTRCNQKVVLSENVEGKDFNAQHKSHIGKEMYIVMTGFVPVDNDITKGGNAYTISLVRVGRKVKAKKRFIQKGLWKRGILD